MLFFEGLWFILINFFQIRRLVVLEEVEMALLKIKKELTIKQRLEIQINLVTLNRVLIKVLKKMSIKLNLVVKLEKPL